MLGGIEPRAASLELRHRLAGRRIHTESGHPTVTVFMTESTLTPVLRIATFNELYLNEQEILRRLSERPDRQKAFVCHPFRVLAEVNVQLSEGVCRGLLKRNPALGMLSHRAYDAMHEQGAAEGTVQLHIEGLFRR